MIAVHETIRTIGGGVIHVGTTHEPQRFTVTFPVRTDRHVGYAKALQDKANHRVPVWVAGIPCVVTDVRLIYPHVTEGRQPYCLAYLLEVEP